MDDLVETWQIHDRITQYLLDGIPDDALSGLPLNGKGRSVGEILAHIHNVRLMWLKSADPELLEGLAKLEKPAAIDRAALAKGLAASGAAIATLIGRAEATGRIRGFKPHVTAFAGYLISHESHHRGEIEVILTQAGHPLDKKTSFGLWEWGVR